MKIAIIGSGISGISSAWLLSKKHQVTVFEKNNYAGGHANTVEIDYPLEEKIGSATKKIAVDTGFIVYNLRTYHHLQKLFQYFEVSVKKSIMSFGVTCKDKIEYSGSSFSGLFANKKNFFNLKFWRMLFDICRFNRKATKLVLNQKVSAITLNEFISSLSLGKYFKKYYLFPMASAIWSCPIEMMKNYPAQTFLRFFYNHGLLTIFNQPAWYTVDGGSKEYVKKMLQKLKSEIELNCAAKKVNYDDKKNKIVLIDEKEKEHEFDQVIFACHGDEALELIQDKIPLQQKILSKFKYSENIAVLHRDASQMPKNKKAWASWIYLSDFEENRVSVSYWMNNLQNISNDLPLFVTLNPIKEIDPNLVFGEYIYHHPIFDSEAIAAQEKLEQIQGVHNMWFCGSYTRYGFHEDGLLSAINIANKFDIRAPWQ